MTPTTPPALDDTALDALEVRANRHGYDIRATHDSLMLTGDLAAAVRALRQRIVTLEQELSIVRKDRDEYALVQSKIRELIDE